MRRRKLKVYSEHLCCTCRDMTTNKSYCNKCLKGFVNPTFVKSEISIQADIDGSYGPNGRNETIEPI